MKTSFNKCYVLIMGEKYFLFSKSIIEITSEMFSQYPLVTIITTEAEAKQSALNQNSFDSPLVFMDPSKDRSQLKYNGLII